MVGRIIFTHSKYYVFVSRSWYCEIGCSFGLWFAKNAFIAFIYDFLIIWLNHFLVPTHPNLYFFVLFISPNISKLLPSFPKTQSILLMLIVTSMLLPSPNCFQPSFFDSHMYGATLVLLNLVLSRIRNADIC